VGRCHGTLRTEGDIRMSKKFLGLNIIVGKGEEKELERCLKSCTQGELFDEMVVTQTFEDENVRAVIEKYGARREFFAWVKDFSLARNKSFSHSTSEMIIWLDSDDVIKPDDFKKLQELKPKIKDFDIVLIDYVYNHDERDNATLVLPRERIVRNCDYIKWHDPIHEYLNMDVPPNKILKTKIKIDHYRVKNYDPSRNLDALRLAYGEGKCSPRLKFYFGKELSDCGYWEEAIKVLEPYIEEGVDFRDNMTVACIRLSKYHYENKNYAAAKTYAMKGIRFNSIYAENYVTVATIFEIENDLDSAASYYKEALTKKLDAGMSQIVDFYGFIPAAKLAILYFAKKEYEECLKYCDIALQHKSDNVQIAELKKTVSIETERMKKGSTIREEDEARLRKMLEELDFKIDIQKNNHEYAEIRLSRIRKLEVVWLVPTLDLDNPSIRIRRYNVSKKMEELKVPSRIITNYYGRNVFDLRNEIGPATVVVFTQYSSFDLELMRHLKPLGIKTVFDHCEAIFGYPFEHECMIEADLVACCSTKLEELTNKNGVARTAVLKDAVEERVPSTERVYTDRYLKPKAGYFGMGGNSFLISEWLKDTIESAGYDVVLSTEWSSATHKWSIDTWPDVMNECDVILCPQRVDVQPAKSSVKATTAMALGMPVLASPLQAYKEVIQPGVNGYICDTKDDWYSALVQLKDSNLRKSVGTAAKKAVDGYSLENITKGWIETLGHLINERLKFPEPEVVEKVAERNIVDIIIANYGNVEYLKMCMSSIFMNTLYPYHVIISDAGSDEKTWEYLKTLKGVTILGEPGKRVSFSEACNAGIQASRTKFFVILNSDVIVSKCWLTSLVDKMEHTDRLAACGVLSNCDRGWLFSAPGKPEYPMRLEKSGVDLVPGMKIGTIQPHVEELYDFMKKSNETYKGKYIKQDWVAAYATIFARCAIDEVGLFDTQYKNGCEDWDLCQRISRYGYAIGQAIDSFVYHFGGVTRGSYEEENKESYKKEDMENHIKMRRKWDKERVVIYTGPAWESWNKQKVDEGMAGSETWAAYLAREFVKKGYRTTIYNDLLVEDKSQAVLDPVQDDSGKSVGDVFYRHYTNLNEDVKYDVVDYFISSRTLDPFQGNVHSLKNYAMIHDVFLNPNPDFDIMPWRIHGYAYLSEWHKDFLKSHHRMPEDKMFLTANGVDHTLYADVDTYEKKNQTVYSSSLDRGLYQLLLMLPEIRKSVPDFKVIVCYGLLNWEKSIKAHNDVQSMELLNKIKSLMEQPGVEYRGRVDKKTLSILQKESKVFLFSSWFAETFCCHPDNEIFTEKGPKRIVSLNIVDRVLTHNNRFRNITKILSRPYSGDLVKFNVQNHKAGTGMYTPEHPVLVLRGGNVSKLRSNRSFIKLGKKPDYSPKSIAKYDIDPEWVEAGDVLAGDYVCMPYCDDRSPDDWFYPLEDMKRVNRNYKIVGEHIISRESKIFKRLPAKIKMDFDFARFLGFYFSEGCFSGGCVKFSFNTKETEYINFVSSYADRVFGVKPKIKNRGNWVEIWCYMNSMGILLKELCGHEASQKKVPYFMYRQDKSFVREFVRAVFEGDGHENKNEFTMVLATKKGMVGLKILAASIGLHPSYRNSPRFGRDYYTMGISKKLWSDLFVGKKDYGPKGTYRVYFERNSKIFYKIKSIDKVPYVGPVYNLEVEEDQSYTSDFIAVHNCCTAVENGLSKNPILSTDFAGLKTTVGSAGILLPYEGLSRDADYPDTYKFRFVEESIRLLKDDTYRAEWADKAYQKMQAYRWDKVADGWIEKFKK